MQLAHDYFHKYLSDNIADADTLERMKTRYRRIHRPRSPHHRYEMY